MPYFKPNTNFKMQNPLKKTGGITEEIKVKGGKGGKSKAQIDYEKRLDTLAMQEVARGSVEGTTPREDYKKVYAGYRMQKKQSIKQKHKVENQQFQEKEKYLRVKCPRNIKTKHYVNSI